MAKCDIAFPINATLSSLCRFSERLMEIEQKDEICVNAGHLGFATPTAMIFLTQACRQRRKHFPKETRRYFGLKKLDYANNLGFSEELSLKGKPFKQGAFGGRSYIPISALQRDTIEASAEDKMIPVGEEIETRCGELAEVVSQGRSKSLRDALQQSFCEIIRNSFEHAEANKVRFCAQHWPSRDEVEICIVDEGIGVRASLETGKYNIPCSDEEALKFAIMPGVSSKAWRAKKKKAAHRSPWDNAGYGLFFAHHLFGGLGHFFIASGTRGLLLTSGKASEFDCRVDGTLVSLRLDLSSETEIEKVINGVSKRAHEVKEKLGVKSLDIKSIDAYLEKGSS